MITASLVLYKTPDAQLIHLLQCVEASAIARVYVYDNSSMAHSREVCSRFAKAQYQEHPNTGYGSTHNQGIREARAAGAEYHVVLNPDVFFEPGVIAELEAFAKQDPAIGQVMPKVVYPDGRLQYLCKLLPRPVDLFARRFLPESIRKKMDYRFCLQFTDYNHIMEVPYLSGCFMFLRMEVLEKVGGFDERYFMYAEDVDLARRMHAASKTVYYPAVTVVHAHAAASYHSRKMLWVHVVNMSRYFNKWGWLFDKERREVNRTVLNQLGYTR